MQDARTMYRAVSARDRRFDGRFVFAVTSTGVYCRPSCPARTPRPENVRYYPLPAAAVAAGFRACRRCRPDAVPGTRAWDESGALASRALRLVADGVLDEGGVAGLAQTLAVSERHLHRTLVTELGVGPSALGRSRRAQTARLLLEHTDTSVTEVAFAAGFSSIRQYNDVMRAEFGCSPSELRRDATTDRPAQAGPLTLRLHTRPPWSPAATIAFLSARAVPGLEVCVDGHYRRAVRTPHGLTLLDVRAEPAAAALRVTLRLPQLRDVSAAVTATRRLFDLDADSAAADAVLGQDPALRPLVTARPGLRVPGTVDGFELAVRAVVGQQVSVAGARTVLSRIVARHGLPAPPGDAGQAPLLGFPTPAALAEEDLDGLGLTGRRIAAIRALARAVAGATLQLRPGADGDEQRAALLQLPGVGPWTADYIAMRALADPDAFPATDLVLARVVRERGLDPTRWRPWRAYAAMHVWSAASQPPTARPTREVA